MALPEACRVMKGLRQVVAEHGIKYLVIVINQDNNDTIECAKGVHDRHSSKRKHIYISHNFIMDLGENNELRLIEV